MKYLFLILAFSLCTSCITYPEKKYHLFEYNKKQEYYIYNAKYKNQNILAFDILQNEKQVFKIAEAYLENYEKYDDIEYFNEYDIKKCKLVNNNTIWKVMFIRKEKKGTMKADVFYFFYFRKKDGALLFRRRLSPKHYSIKHLPKL